MAYLPVPSDFVRSAHISCDNGLLGHDDLAFTAAAAGTQVLVAAFFRHRGEPINTTPAFLHTDSVVRCVAVDAARGRFAIAGDGKLIRLYNITQGHSKDGETIPSFHVHDSTPIGPFNKRIVAMAFDHASGSLWAGDKFGEVYVADFARDDGTAKLRDAPLLSHMSMITRIAIRNNNLVTCDRDGTIRVSRLDMPDDIRGLLWYPPAALETLIGADASDSIATCTAWGRNSLLFTGSVEGLVGAWDLNRRDVDQDVALVSSPAAVERVPVTGFPQLPNGHTFVAFDGSKQLRTLDVETGVDSSPHEVFLPSPIVAAEDQALLLRDGSIAVVRLRGGAATVMKLPNASFTSPLDDVDVRTLWHTRQQVAGGALEDDDECPEKIKKRPPRAEGAMSE
jgi:WD40 repeat protein